jgi:hypothetical protein
MDRIDVTEYLPEKVAQLSPEDLAARQQVASEIAHTDFSVNGLFGTGLDTLWRTVKSIVSAAKGTATGH